MKMKDLIAAANSIFETSYEDIKKEISRQMGGRDVEIEHVHIDEIEIGDTVFHEGQVKTISSYNLKKDKFMGPTIDGDSYNIGHKQVIRLKLRK